MSGTGVGAGVGVGSGTGSEPLLSVQGLTCSFGRGARAVTAVSDVSFEVGAGEVLGLVGESGSGKSVTLRGLMRLLPSGARVGGRALWRGRDLLALPEPELRRVRGGEVSMIFQEPMTALNPVLPVGLQIEESLRAHAALGRSARRARARELLDQVGIPDAGRRLEEYPHQFSGGMRQRAMIAIALASGPRLLLADEPTTALDVTIQDQILKLILALKDEMGLGVVLVTHDLGVVAEACDRVAVMYAGRIVEEGRVPEVFASPRHAYTLGLLGSVPRAGAERTPLRSIEGTPPGLAAIPPGCAFNPRCGFATALCREGRPELSEGSPGRRAACHHGDRVAAAAREAA